VPPGFNPTGEGNSKKYVNFFAYFLYHRHVTKQPTAKLGLPNSKYTKATRSGVSDHTRSRGTVIAPVMCTTNCPPQAPCIRGSEHMGEFLPVLPEG